MNASAPSLRNTSPALEDIPENALRIMFAAMSLFARKGYAATSVREIVQEAQVTNPMLYYYFDSKEGLFVFLTEFLHRSFVQDLTTAFETSETLEDALIAVVRTQMRGVRESPDALRFVYALLFGAEGSCPVNDLHASHQEVSVALQAVFQRAIDSGEFEPAFEVDWLVYQMLGLANSHSMRLIIEMEKVREEVREQWLEENTNIEMARRLVRLFLRGASKEIEK